MTEDNIAEIIKALKPMLPSRIEGSNSFVGKKFGKLTILDVPGRSRKRKCIMVRCQCDCGNLMIAALSDVKRSHTTSCGCSLLARRNIHGEASSIDKKASSEYTAWSRLRVQVYKHCSGLSHSLLSDHVCKRWMEKDKGYINFLEDMGRKPLMSQLRKRDKTKRYDKDNCYWRITK